ncbi:MAG: MFS transporter [Clostridia bacterium]|nr:MFS transporter [Clostridia bacterium]
MRSYKRLKYACYTGNITMSAVGSISPLLFLTFREQYGLSYSLLGTLVLVNFFTQLIIDLIFSFFSHKFNIALTVRLMPIFSVVGLVLFAAAPILFPNAVYLGLVLGIIIFSVSAGLAEVLISPVIAAIPAENPDHEMSKLHSVYAWGVVGVVIVATLFLLFVGQEYWQILPLIFALIPLLSTVLFFTSDVPKLDTPEKTSGAVRFLKNPSVWLCVIGIFLGGASECTMAQWASSYLEGALGIPKVWGDIFGVALFAMALGIGRSLYAKIGKNAPRVLLLGALGASACYLIAAFSPFAVVGLIACAFTGFCVSMLWPGSLIVASDRFPSGGVLIYALMAAGGDFGASVGPQLVGIASDAVIASSWGTSLAARLGIGTESLGMKAGMIVGALFPILAIFVYLRIVKTQKRYSPSLSI